MKKILLIIPIIIILVGCSVTYNKPFINSEETTKLSFGMTQKDAIRVLGDPLYVESGGNGKVVYMYEVRTVLVKSNLTTGQPNKNHVDQKHDGPIHELRLTFENGGLKSWGEK